MKQSTPAAKVAPRPRPARVGGRRPARTLARGEVLASSVMCRPSCRRRLRWSDVVEGVLV
eukprot:6376137-Pyramimonas_sp.AAC.1